jgi:hypothetical protein
LRRFAEDRRKITGEEVTKLFVSGFIVEVMHTEWLANPILVEKKKGRPPKLRKLGACVLTTPIRTRLDPKIRFRYLGLIK